MSVEIKMPALSPTMESGNLVKWHVKEGDKVSPGDILAEIETDKATMEVESADEGVVAQLTCPEGSQNVPVGTVIAILSENQSTVTVKTPALHLPVPQPSPPKAPTHAIPSPKYNLQAAPPPLERSEGMRVKASPLARRLAQEQEINLVDVEGSGPGGRIVKSDLVSAKTNKLFSAASLPSLSDEVPKSEISIPNIRKIVAQRLTHSKQTIPHYYLTIEADITELLQTRRQINSTYQDNRVSVNDFIIKALALSLIKTPEAHVQWLDNKMFQLHRADISVAVAIPDGLITPIVKAANLKTLRTIASEMRVLIDKAKSGKLKPEEFQGGTFSISNLGMYGIRDFAAVINPPQSGIVAIGATAERPVLLKDGSLENRSFILMTGSFDHRAVDGATGAKLLSALKELLEHPALLLY